ncbi:peptidylprolyl isomerase [Caulobacter sp. S45]|uniref:peptidylprolyl isomerase n=1 Tax=Caulobacter sp. S45 TaxID=1641861 RepID=UPI00131BD387|nr:peptidylprolyl isomerase [Caulobacter sp. S45]
MLAPILAAAILVQASAPAAPASPHAPEVFDVTVSTTKGPFVIEIHRAWSPNGADRFYELANAHYYDDSRFFRTVAGKWVQFGIAGDPAMAKTWRGRTIPDDALVQHNLPGYIGFSNTGPGTRSTQVYINLRDNSAQNDGEAAFAPFGKVVQGMDVVESLYSGYGETSGSGMRAGHQDAMFEGGDAYLDAKFPKLDKLISLKVTAPRRSGAGRP